MVNTLTDSPISTHTLAQDQPLMEENNKYYAHTLIVDHQIGDASAGLTGGRTDATAKEGYHKVIHYVTNGADPGVIANVGQLYTKVVGGDVALFYESALGVIQQITTNVTPVNANPGISFLPGGLIIKFGSSNALTADGTTVNFNAATAFSNLLSLTVAHTSAGASPATQAIVSADNISATSFRLRVSGAASASYSYIAIGN